MAELKTGIIESRRAGIILAMFDFVRSTLTTQIMGK
jgi:hypothetical protein